jgi:hypothetical protein
MRMSEDPAGEIREEAGRGLQLPLRKQPEEFPEFDALLTFLLEQSRYPLL